VNFQTPYLEESAEDAAARRRAHALHAAAANARRQAAKTEAQCIRLAGGDPDTARGARRRKLVERGRAIKAEQRRAMQAGPKRLHESRLREAMPSWADRDAIAEVYAEARRLTVETGTPHEVDHIVPLLGVGVCGLHWEGNLQVLPMTANRRKSNSLRP
jgi:hypothetical protein